MIPTPPKNDGSRDARSMPEPYSSLWVSLCSNDFTTITDELCDSFMRNLNLSLNERQTVKSYLIVCGMVRAKEAMIALLEDFQKTFIANQDSFGDEAGFGVYEGVETLDCFVAGFHRVTLEDTSGVTPVAVHVLADDLLRVHNVLVITDDLQC